MKKLFVLLVCCIICATTHAQSYNDCVYLKNGSIIKGNIVKQDANEVVIKTDDGKTYTYSLGNVLKISNGDYNSTSSYNHYRGTSYSTNGLDKGFRAILSVGHNFKASDYGEASVEFNSSFGYQFNPHIYLGGGAGVMYLYGNSELFAIPTYVNFRYDMLDKSLCPFLDIKAGYSAYDAHGAYLAGSLGFRIRTGEKFGLSVSGGYEAFIAEYNKSYRYSSYENVGDVFVRLGFEF